MHPVLKRSLIFIALMIAGLALYVKWFDIRADRYDRLAVPYLETAVPVITGWRIGALEPLLSPDARRDFENPALREAYLGFSRLGGLQSMRKPQFLSAGSATSQTLGDVELVEYEVAVEFDSGAAKVKITLLVTGERHFVHHFSFSSAFLAEDS